MIRCNHCKEFIEPDDLVVVYDDPSPKGIALPSGSYAYTYCPHCGSDDYEESFSLIDEIDLEEEDDTSVIVSFEGKRFCLYLDEYGELDVLPMKEEKKEVTKAGREVA